MPSSRLADVIDLLRPEPWRNRLWLMPLVLYALGWAICHPRRLL